MPTARTLEAEWGQVLRGSVSTGAKEDGSITGGVWAAGCTMLGPVLDWGAFLNLRTSNLFNFPFFFGPR
jgi:hypothetical protein